MTGVTADRPVDNLTGSRRTPHERDVLLRDLPFAKLARQLPMGGIMFGHHHDTRRASIEPVDDARAGDAPDAAQITHVVKQCVHECAPSVARGRVHNHPGGLVDDHEVFVLIENCDGQVFWDGRGGDRPRHRDIDGLTRLQPEAGFGGAR